MKRKQIVSIGIIALISLIFSFKKDSNVYQSRYNNQLNAFINNQRSLIEFINGSTLQNKLDKEKIKSQLHETRLLLKQLDFWLRYLEPLIYKKINGPLPVEWETEVFEKFEKPYRREGAGITLAEIYLEEDVISKDSLSHLMQSSLVATKIFISDSIQTKLKEFDHFYLCNRLFLLNLATIYTTGFECPDTDIVIKELLEMLEAVKLICIDYNKTFSNNPLPDTYVQLFNQTIEFVKKQPLDYNQFNHFEFIKRFVNPLFSINQNLIQQYQVHSKSNIDYTLNKNATSIFSKNLYFGQNTKGVYKRVNDPKILSQIEEIGKLLFYDPILSANNLRSCASCHLPNQYFTNTTNASALNFDREKFLPRNSPSLLNVTYNHLIMQDGKLLGLQEQTRAVITNPDEMASSEKDVLNKILNCKEYQTAFQSFLKLTPEENHVTFDHICSAITLYYGKFSKYYSPFDRAMNHDEQLSDSVIKGFNIFMSKAQCGTCHFAPQFNGVKPPYVSSEFEVLGVPKDTAYKNLSDDLGRFQINPAKETHRAFRTGTIRNAERTKPYMHNGVFKSLKEVIDFYDGGGGLARGLNVPNQTLSSDSLHLTELEKKYLIDFVKSLNESIEFDKQPEKLPLSKNKKLNNRKVGGEY